MCKKLCIIYNKQKKDKDDKAISLITHMPVLIVKLAIN